MPDSAPSQEAANDTARSFDQGVEDISNLLDGPETAPVEGEDREANIDAEPGDEPGPDDIEATDDDDSTDEEEAGPDYSKGKFASDDAKVTLKDGSILSVTDLKRGYLAQQDSSRRDQELRAKEHELKANNTKMNEIAQALVAQRDFLLQYQEQHAPKEPSSKMLDPQSPDFDLVAYWQQKAQYDDAQKARTTMDYHRQAEAQRMKEEADEALRSFKSEEAKKLFERVPEFRKPEVYNKFWSDAQQVMSEKYGITPEELAETYDSRMYVAMRDLVKFHKAQAAAPKVKEQLQGKPQMLKGGQRPDPKTKISRDAKSRTEELRRTGRPEAAVAAIMDLL